MTPEQIYDAVFRACVARHHGVKAAYPKAHDVATVASLAPELLDVIRQAADVLERYADADDCDGPTGCACVPNDAMAVASVARALIAKADGQ